MRAFARKAPATLLVLLGCAGGEEAARRDMDALRAELRALRRDHDGLVRELDAVGARVDLLSARASAPGRDEPAAASVRAEQGGAEQGAAVGVRAAAPVIPPDLEIFRIEPGASPPRTPPPVPTAVPIGAPDPERVEALVHRRGGDLGAEAEAELGRARARRGPERAGALQAFADRYPRHPSADNALVEASAALAEAGRDGVACELAGRARDDYPAGDAMSDALERLAWCEARRGASDAERALLERLVAEHPRTPAAARAGTRLATLSGRPGGTPDAASRSGP